MIDIGFKSSASVGMIADGLQNSCSIEESIAFGVSGSEFEVPLVQRRTGLGHFRFEDLRAKKLHLIVWAQAGRLCYI